MKKMKPYGAPRVARFPATAGLAVALVITGLAATAPAFAQAPPAQQKSIPLPS